MLLGGGGKQGQIAGTNKNLEKGWERGEKRFTGSRGGGDLRGKRGVSFGIYCRKE